MNFLCSIKLEFIVCNSEKDYSTNGLLSFASRQGLVLWISILTTRKRQTK